MNFREIFRFELGYQVRRVYSWLFFATLFAFAVLVTRVISLKEAKHSGIFINAPYFFLNIIIFGTLIWLMIAAVVAGEAAARDVQTRMYPLTYTTPVSKADYLGGKFLAAFVLNALILLALPLGILFAIYFPGIESEMIGPSRPAAYLGTYFFIAFPNAFVATAIQFSWATSIRRSMASYLASGLIFIITHIGVGGFAAFIKHWELTEYLDLVGLVGIAGRIDSTWTVAEKSTRPLALEGSFLFNRLIWIGIALGSLAITYTRFGFTKGAQRTRWNFFKRRKKPDIRATTLVPTAKSPVSIPRVHRTFGFSTWVSQTLGIAMDSFRKIIKIRTGLLFVMGFMGAVFLFGSALTRFGDIPMIPTTGRVLSLLAAKLSATQHPLILIPLLTIYYAGELMWREREARLSEIVDTAPVPEWVLFLGKFIGLGLVLVVWMIFLMAAGFLIQIDRTYYNFEIGLYLKILFGLQLSNYLLFALLVLVLHVIADQKYLGHMLALGAFGFIVSASMLSIRHHLLVYASDPGWSYTDIRGFGATLQPVLWFKAYWVSWALLFAVLAKLLWPRGKGSSLRTRIKMAAGRFTRATAFTASTALGFILITGGYIFYNTNILNTYNSTSDNEERSAKYEQLYGRYKGIPQPQMTATTLRVEIHPERLEAEIHGTYRLVNNNSTAIDSIHLATMASVETEEITFNRPATKILEDKELGHRIYAFKQPLQPGDSVQLSFEVKYKPHGFRNNGIDTYVAANGTVFTNEDWLPTIGYQSNRELGNGVLRKKYKLSARAAVPSLRNMNARRQKADDEPIILDATIGTSSDQIAVAPGSLRRQWTEQGRSYFRYITEVPVFNEYAIMSARYAVHTGLVRHGLGDGRKDIAIRIYHHPTHTMNLDRMVRSAQASLNYYTKQFGPYPHRQIAFAEYPDPSFSEHARAAMVTYQEGFALMDPTEKGLDLPYVVTAHELAHEWWGWQMRPAHVEGEGVMAEGLAVYSSTILLKGPRPEQLPRYLDFLRSSYEIPRARGAVPLLRSSNSFLDRRKSPLALYTLSEYIGEEKLNGALKQLFVKNSTGTPPLPTTFDLYREMKAATPDSLQYLLHDLFGANTFWELHTEQATAKQTKPDQWLVSLEIRARKVVVNPAGVETDIPMNDLLEIGIYPSETGKPLYMQKQRIRSGKQTITVTVSEKPVRAGIDPNQLMIELDTGDNVATIKD